MTSLTASGTRITKGGGKTSLPFNPPSPTPILIAAADDDEDDEGGKNGLGAAAAGGGGRPKWPAAPASREEGPEGAAHSTIGTPTPMMPFFDNVYNEDEDEGEDQDAFAFSK